jgi:hypothetical protein
MEADKSELNVLHRALNEWEQTGKLTGEQAEELRRSIVVKQTDRQQIAQYFFFVALFCTLLAFGAIFINERLLEKIKVYFSLNNIIICLISAGLAALWFWYTGRKRTMMSPNAYEVYMVLGGLAVLTSLIYLCKFLELDKTYTAFLGMALPVLALLTFMLRSRALWIGTIATSIAWYGSFTDWQSQNYLFLGMNYPMRFTVFGLVITAVSFLQSRIRQVSFTARMTYIAGLALFFTGLWGVSIFGNFNSLTEWQHVRQSSVLFYSIIFGAFSVLSFYLGIRYKDELARDFGILFLLINLYTRYFEYFWDAMNKGIFFIILAVTFGLLGRWFEKKRHPGVKQVKV